MLENFAGVMNIMACGWVEAQAQMAFTFWDAHLFYDS